MYFLFYENVHTVAVLHICADLILLHVISCYVSCTVKQEKLYLYLYYVLYLAVYEHQKACGFKVRETIGPKI